MGPLGSSAKTLTSEVEFGSLPTARPPSLTKSFALNSDTFPTPMTTSRSVLSPAGKMRSKAELFLPVKRSAFAARDTRPAAAPNAFRVAGPYLRPSSQNTTTAPLPGILKGPKPSLRAPVIEERSFFWQADGGGNTTVPYGAATGPVQSPIQRIRAF